MGLNGNEIAAKYSMAEGMWYCVIDDALPFYERELGLPVDGQSNVVVKVPPGEVSALGILQGFGVAEYGQFIANKENAPLIQTRTDRWKLWQDPKLYINDAKSPSIVNEAPNPNFKQREYTLKGQNFKVPVSSVKNSWDKEDVFVIRRGATPGPLVCYIDTPVSLYVDPIARFYADCYKQTGGSEITLQTYLTNDDRTLFRKVSGGTNVFTNHTADSTYHKIGWAVTITPTSALTYRRFVLSVAYVPAFGYLKIKASGVGQPGSQGTIVFSNSDWKIEKNCDSFAPEDFNISINNWSQKPVSWKGISGNLGENGIETGLTLESLSNGTPSTGVNIRIPFDSSLGGTTGSGTNSMSASVSVTGGTASVTPFLQYLTPISVRKEPVYLPRASVIQTISGTTLVTASSGVVTASATGSQPLGTGNLYYVGGYWNIAVSSASVSVDLGTPAWIVNGSVFSGYTINKYYFENTGTSASTGSILADLPASPYVTGMQTYDDYTGDSLWAPSEVMVMVRKQGTGKVTVGVEGTSEWISVTRNQLLSARFMVKQNSTYTGVGGGGGNLIRVSALWYDGSKNLLSKSDQTTNIENGVWTECRLDGASSTSASVAFARIELQADSRDGVGVPQFSQFAVANACIAKDISSLTTYTETIRCSTGFQSTILKRDDSKLVNFIQYDSPLGSSKYSDIDSINRFGLRGRVISTTAMPGTYLDSAGAFNLQRSLTLDDRIEEVSFVVENSSQERLVAALFPGDVAYFDATLGASTIRHRLRIESILITATAGGKFNIVTLGLSNADYDNATVLSYSRLGVDRTAF